MIRKKKELNTGKVIKGANGNVLQDGDTAI